MLDLRITLRLTFDKSMFIISSMSLVSRLKSTSLTLPLNDTWSISRLPAVPKMEPIMAVVSTTTVRADPSI